jgi:uncharacterized protein YoxC
MAPFNQTSHGLPQVVLAILIAWALTAVLLLTGTLINAREIDRRVIYINSQLAPINQDTSEIALAGKTNVIASRILAAVPTLSPGLQKTSNDVTDINKTVKTILATARQINTKVSGISGSVGTIHATVGTINSTVTAIHSDVVGSITPKLARTGRDVTTIHNNVASINGHVDSILGSVNSIQPDVVSINGKADAIQASVNGNGQGTQILPDFININTLVGRAPNDPHTINGHANSIDCSKILNLLGPTSGCGK